MYYGCTVKKYGKSMIIGQQKYSTESRKLRHYFAQGLFVVGGAPLVFCLFAFFALTSAFIARQIQAQTAQTTSQSCVRAGCSGERCVSAQSANTNGGLATTCIFRGEYACYQQAECGVLSSGECGWLPSAELAQCMQNALGEPVITGDDRCAMTGEGCEAGDSEDPTKNDNQDVDDPTDDQNPDTNTETNFTIDPETGLCKTSDLTGDSRTDIQDYTFLISQFMTSGARATLPADLNCDGIVDLIDYSLLKRNFNL